MLTMKARDYVRELSAKVEKKPDVQIINTFRDQNDWKPMAASSHARNTVNPIRRICDAMAVQPNPDKSLIKLHLGDPTLTGTLLPSPQVTDAIHAVVSAHKYDGYLPSTGCPLARQAIVDKYSCQDAPFTSDDVILASGASHALQLAIEAIADAGDNILIPNPGFPLYSTLCRPHGIEDRAYNLNMKKGAIIDLLHMESLIDERTRAIIINNPSNPTGAVFSRRHLQDILAIANRHRVPIIADEIYGDLTYDGAEFIPIATLSPKVPVISVDGIAKRWLVPGWRLGWCIIHDHYDVLSDVKKGMVALSQKIVGPNAIVQGALPSILQDTPEEFFENTKAVISANAKIFYNKLRRVPGLLPVKPSGAMYMMVGIDKKVYGEETPFVQGLISEQSVFCLPGTAFSAPGWLRLVLTYPPEISSEACDRIIEFCNKRVVRNHVRMDSESTVDEGCPSADEGEGSDEDSANNDESDDSSVCPLFP